MTQIKIILFNGGFAGDLLTVLHNPDLFKGFNPNGSIKVDTRVTRLKWHKYRSAHNHEQKIKYLNSIEHLGVCASHDLEFSLRMRSNTILLICSDSQMAKYFFDRKTRTDPDMKMDFEGFLKWQDNSLKLFKNFIDMSKMHDKNFLKSHNIDKPESRKILNNWIQNNEYC